MGMQKIYICGTLPFTALEDNSTMMTSGNVKKVDISDVEYVHAEYVLYKY